MSGTNIANLKATSREAGSAVPLDVHVLDASGNPVSFGGSGGTASTDDAGFTAASGSGTPIMGFVTSDAVDSGDVGVVGMDTARNLKVSIEVDNVGIGGGTQYTEGDTDATITGTAILWEDASDTLRAASKAKPLPVSGTGGATIVSGQVTVDTTLGGVEIVAARSGRESVTIMQHGTTAFYIGPSGLTTSDGLLVVGVQGAGQVLNTSAAVYGITASGSTTVGYIEVYG